MSKRIPVAVAIALILVFCALTVVLTVSVYLRLYYKSLIFMSQQSKQYTTLTEIEDLVRANFNGRINAADENIYTAKGYVEGLGDKNSFYLTAAEYAGYTAEVLGTAEGVGIRAEFSSLDSSLKITEVAEGSSAASNRLAVGDKILSVDQKDVTVNNYGKLLDKLCSGTEGEVRIRLWKAAAAAQTEVSLPLGYQIASVHYTSAGSVGYIRISAFYDATEEDFRHALQSLTGAGVSKLILDVRNNASTNYDAAAKIIDMLVPIATEGSRAIATAVDANGDTVKVYSSNAESFSIPIAVLINDRTDGAAELVAADLRDFLNAKLIGETTAGNAGMQKEFLLEDGSALILTVAKIKPCVTESYDGTGITPDTEIFLPDFQKDAIETLEHAEDAQYKAALSSFGS